MYASSLHCSMEPTKSAVEWNKMQTSFGGKCLSRRTIMSPHDVETSHVSGGSVAYRVGIVYTKMNNAPFSACVVRFTTYAVSYKYGRTAERCMDDCAACSRARRGQCSGSRASEGERHVVPRPPRPREAG